MEMGSSLIKKVDSLFFVKNHLTASKYQFFHVEGLFLSHWGVPRYASHDLREQLPIYTVLQSFWASLVAQTVKNLPAVQETWVQSLGWEDPLEKGMATHSSVPAWITPWTEKPEELQAKSWT